jgi:hypothetical protein
MWIIDGFPLYIGEKTKAQNLGNVPKLGSKCKSEQVAELHLTTQPVLPATMFRYPLRVPCIRYAECSKHIPTSCYLLPFLFCLAVPSWLISYRKPKIRTFIIFISSSDSMLECITSSSAAHRIFWEITLLLQIHHIWFLSYASMLCWMSFCVHVSFQNSYIFFSKIQCADVSTWALEVDNPGIQLLFSRWWW